MTNSEKNSSKTWAGPFQKIRSRALSETDRFLLDKYIRRETGRNLRFLLFGLGILYLLPLFTSDNTWLSPSLRPWIFLVLLLSGILIPPLKWGKRTKLCRAALQQGQTIEVFEGTVPNGYRLSSQFSGLSEDEAFLKEPGSIQNLETVASLGLILRINGKPTQKIFKISSIELFGEGQHQYSIPLGQIHNEGEAIQISRRHLTSEEKGELRRIARAILWGAWPPLVLLLLIIFLFLSFFIGGLSVDGQVDWNRGGRATAVIGVAFVILRFKNFGTAFRLLRDARTGVTFQQDFGDGQKEEILPLSGASWTIGGIPAGWRTQRRN